MLEEEIDDAEEEVYNAQVIAHLDFGSDIGSSSDSDSDINILITTVLILLKMEIKY